MRFTIWCILCMKTGLVIDIVPNNPTIQWSLWSLQKQSHLPLFLVDVFYFITSCVTPHFPQCNSITDRMWYIFACRGWSGSSPEVNSRGQFSLSFFSSYLYLNFLSSVPVNVDLHQIQMPFCQYHSAIRTNFLHPIKSIKTVVVPGLAGEAKSMVLSNNHV